MDNWQIIGDGGMFLHFGKDNIRLCDTVKHNIMQAAPSQLESDVRVCTACSILIAKINKSENEKEQAWDLYCKEAGMCSGALDYWEQVPLDIQKKYLDKIKNQNR